MTPLFEMNNQLLRAWLLLHQTSNGLIRAEDSVFANVGLTTQHHSVLIAMKYIEKPVTPSKIANWLDRSTNTISTLIDRMQRDGLVKRVRDLNDRRSVRVIMTKKGEDVLEKSTALGWPLMQEILQGLTEEELKTLINLLDIVRGRAFSYLNPGKKMGSVRIAGEKKRRKGHQRT